MRKLTKKKRIGIALGGGGAKGISHIAFLKALDEMGVKPSIISGTSIGAIVGAFYAAGVSAAEMEDVLRKVRIKDVNKMVDLSGGLTVQGKGLERFFERLLPVRRFEELQIPLKVVAADFWGRREVIFQAGEIIPAIRASMAIPGLVKPVKIDNMVLVDGGAVNPVPYDIIREESDILIAINVSGTRTPRRPDNMPTLMESIMATFQIMQATIIEHKLRICKPDIYIRPALRNIKILEFYRYAEILQGVAGDVEHFKKELAKWLSKK